MFESLLFRCVSFLAFANRQRQFSRAWRAFTARGALGYLFGFDRGDGRAVSGATLFLPRQSIILSLTPNQS